MLLKVLGQAGLNHIFPAGNKQMCDTFNSSFVLLSYHPHRASLMRVWYTHSTATALRGSFHMKHTKGSEQGASWEDSFLLQIASFLKHHEAKVVSSVFLNSASKTFITRRERQHQLIMATLEIEIYRQTYQAVCSL